LIGAGALARLAEDPPPALLVIDSGLPDMAGESTVMNIRETALLLKVFFVTGNDAHGFDHQVDSRTSLLMKPFSLAQLATVVTKLVAV
jgi:CheY-like chemotaxis protein